jgi:hypothetical protein
LSAAAEQPPGEDTGERQVSGRDHHAIDGSLADEPGVRAREEDDGKANSERSMNSTVCVPRWFA